MTESKQTTIPVPNGSMAHIKTIVAALPDRYETRDGYHAVPSSDVVVAFALAYMANAMMSDASEDVARHFECGPGWMIPMPAGSTADLKTITGLLAHGYETDDGDHITPRMPGSGDVVAFALAYMADAIVDDGNSFDVASEFESLKDQYQWADSHATLAARHRDSQTKP